MIGINDKRFYLKINAQAYELIPKLVENNSINW